MKKNNDPLSMHIKNSGNSDKIKAFGSFQTSYLTENLVLRSPTFHILNDETMTKIHYYSLNYEKNF